MLQELTRLPALVTGKAVSLNPRGTLGRNNHIDGLHADTSHRQRDLD